MNMHWSTVQPKIIALQVRCNKYSKYKQMKFQTTTLKSVLAESHLCATLHSPIFSNQILSSKLMIFSISFAVALRHLQMWTFVCKQSLLLYIASCICRAEHIFSYISTCECTSQWYCLIEGSLSGQQYASSVTPVWEVEIPFPPANSSWSAKVVTLWLQCSTRHTCFTQQLATCGEVWRLGRDTIFSKTLFSLQHSVYAPQREVKNVLFDFCSIETCTHYWNGSTLLGYFCTFQSVVFHWR